MENENIKFTYEDYINHRNELFGNVKKCVSTAIIMVGAPGSGKSVTQKLCIKSLKYKYKDFVIIDPDEIYMKIYGGDPLYRRINEYHNDDGSANGRGYDMMIINNLDFEYAVDNRYNLVFDGTGRNYKSIYTNIIRKLRSNDYRIVICINLIDIEIALKRVEKREKETGRIVPEKFIHETYEILMNIIPKYLYLDSLSVDSILVYDNNDKTTLILEIEYDDYGNRKIKCKSDIAFYNNITKKICKTDFRKK